MTTTLLRLTLSNVTDEASTAYATTNVTRCNVLDFEVSFWLGSKHIVMYASSRCEGNNRFGVFVFGLKGTDEAFVAKTSMATDEIVSRFQSYHHMSDSQIALIKDGLTNMVEFMRSPNAPRRV